MVTRDWQDLRVLWLTDPAQDLGSDHLYDGFVSLLGTSQVIDWPSKPLYHAEVDGGAPTQYAHPAHGMTHEDMSVHLRAGFFDVAVIASERRGAVSAAHDVAYMAPTLPLVLLDYLDPQEKVRAALPRVPLLSYRSQRHPGDVERPLHFTFPSRWASDADPRDPHVFFAGTEQGAIVSRKTGWEAMQQGGLRVKGGPGFYSVTFADFRAALRRALVAWCPPGCHWDSNRYWEAAAHGCAILAHQRTREHYGEDAITEAGAMYYENDADLVAKARWMLAHPKFTRVMGHVAFAQFMALHSSPMRAANVLHDIAEAVL